MSNQDNTDAILAALRRAGLVDVIDGPPIPIRASLSTDKYWLVSEGAFSTVVDYRDASSEQEAINVARTDLLQAWYLNAHLPDAITVKAITRNEYIDWLKRGVR